jgi:hypothetical protein
MKAHLPLFAILLRSNLDTRSIIRWPSAPPPLYLRLDAKAQPYDHLSSQLSNEMDLDLDRLGLGWKKGPQ